MWFCCSFWNSVWFLSVFTSHTSTWTAECFVNWDFNLKIGQIFYLLLNIVFSSLGKSNTSNINQCKFLAGHSFYYGNYAKRISPKWWGYYPDRSDPVRSLNQGMRGISNLILIHNVKLWVETHVSVQNQFKIN